MPTLSHDRSEHPTGVAASSSEPSEQEGEQLIPLGDSNTARVQVGVGKNVRRPFCSIQALQFSAETDVYEVKVVNLRGSLMRGLKHATELPGMTAFDPSEVITESRYGNGSELALQAGKRVRNLSGSVGVGRESIGIRKGWLK